MGDSRPRNPAAAAANDAVGDATPNSERIYDAGRLRALFDEMSGTYGLVNFLSSFGFTWRWRRQCVELANLRAKDRVCDLMTGMGECWKEIEKRIGSGGEIVAVDFSRAMIAAARERLPKHPAVRVYESDVFDPAFARDALATEQPGEGPGFSAIVCCFGVKTLEPQMYARLAELCKRLLKPGGRFSFVEISVPSAAILRWPLLFYLRFLIPGIGRLCLGNPDNYRMLGVYTRAFGDCARLHASFVEAGCDARLDRLFFGAATAVSGSVPGVLKESI